MSELKVESEKEETNMQLNEDKERYYRYSVDGYYYIIVKYEDEGLQINCFTGTVVESNWASYTIGYRDFNWSLAAFEEIYDYHSK